MLVVVAVEDPKNVILMYMDTPITIANIIDPIIDTALKFMMSVYSSNVKREPSGGEVASVLIVHVSHSPGGHASGTLSAM